MKRLILITVTLCALTSDLWPAQGKVIRVSDGDTVTILDSGAKVKCRLFGIDAPEKKQPYGQESKQFLTQMILNREVQYEVLDTDMYHRSICMISFDEVDDGIIQHTVVNEQMLVMGMAWAYRQYLKKDFNRTMLYIRLERMAIEDSRGLWKDSDPQPPWEYRRNKRRRRH